MISEHNRRKDKSGKRDPSPPKSGVSPIVRIFRSLNRSINCCNGQAQETEPEHIVNGRIMARWTRIVGIFTVFMTTASVVSAIISYFALREIASSSEQTNKMVAAAVRQAEAVNEQAGLLGKQYELSIIQTRANIRKSGIEGEVTYRTAGERIFWSFNSIFINVGGTDAIDVRYWWKWQAFQANMEARSGCPIAYNKQLDGPTAVIPPGQGKKQGVIRIPEADIVAASKGDASIFIAGRIEYRDIFPNTPDHFYNWCVKVVPNDIERNVFSFIDAEEEKR